MKKYLVLIAMLLAACGEKGTKQEAAVVEGESNSVTVNLTMKDGGSIVTVKSGDEIEIKLDAKDATGYSWQFVSYVKDDGVIEELEDKFVPVDDADNADVKGMGVYKIKMLNPGETIIVANYVSDADKGKQEDREQNDFAVRIISE